MSGLENRERRSSLLVFGVAAVSLAVPLTFFACDTAGEFEDCSADPTTSSGEARCPPSTFPKDEARLREYEMNGAVRRGEVPVGGAVVRMEPDRRKVFPGSGFSPTSTVSNSGGEFRFLSVPVAYDLWVQAGDEVDVFRGLSGRRYDPPLEGELPPPQWTSKVAVRLLEPVAEGHTLTFLAGGANVLGVTGSAETGLIVSARAFSTVATIRVFEHPIGGDLAQVTRTADVEVPFVAAQGGVADLRLAKIGDARLDVTFDVRVPQGFIVDPIETSISVGGGAYDNRAELARVAAGTRFVCPLVAVSWYQARAHRDSDGAVLDSGRHVIEASEKSISVTLAPPPEMASPAAGAVVAPGDDLTVHGDGIIEHLLDPLEGGPRLRILTVEPTSALPDARNIGISAPAGRYRWRARSVFPDVNRIDTFAGPGARHSVPSSTSGPREIILR